MDVLISGLNGYIGRRAASHLSAPGYVVHGLVRDKKLFELTSFEPISASLHTVDLVRGGQEYEQFSLKNLDLGFYFTQSPYLEDKLNLHLELTGLKRYVDLLLRNQCDRLIFVARLMDKDYIGFVQQLLEKCKIKYTIVLKNIALGKGSLADRYFRRVLQNNFIIYDEDMASITFRPVSSLDVMRWIRLVDWKNLFINQTIELGGISTMSVRDVFRLYKKINKLETKGYSIPHFLYNTFFKYRRNRLHPDDLIEMKRMLRYEYPVDNSNWAKHIPFSFTPIDEVILHDV